jgi:hypothetical protein
MLSACEIGRLLEADQVDGVVGRQMFQIGNDLALAERLEHAVIAHVDGGGSIVAVRHRRYPVMITLRVWADVTRRHTPEMTVL